MTEFRVLGPVEIRVDDRVIDAGHARQRAVLAVLLLDSGRVVPAPRLIDHVWGEDPPRAARNALYGYIARLRTILGNAADDGVTLSRRPGGYLIQANPEHVDLHRFRSLVGQAAAAAGDDDAACALLREALALWHGPALAGLDSPWLNAMRDTLELERHAALLDLNDARLRQGQHARLVAELMSHAAAAPADERLAGQLMLALYRSGRQADALRWFEQTRRHLAGELGAEPAPALTDLHQRILRFDPALTVPAAPALAKPAAPVPRELPADVAAFTGRAGELAALDELLLGPPRTTAAVISAVSGTAGVGKTALAVHWAHRTARHFPDGQLHVNLRGYDPAQPVPAADALASLLRALGVRSQDIPPEEAERAARYRSLLAGKRMLILLDNASTVDQVRPLLSGHPDCRVLVTSRDSLAGLVARDGARRIDLDLLPFSDAVALLRELIRDRADAEPAVVAELAKQCAGLPLALRIAAELAMVRQTAALSELVAELSDQRKRLDVLRADGDPRTAVRAVFSWSYDNLDDEAARAFRLAALDPGLDFDAYGLAALTGSSLGQARHALDTLARAHLVQSAGPGRYSMHDLLRSYAREQAAAGDSREECEQALTRLFDYYLTAAAAAMDIFYPAETHARPHAPSPTAMVPSMPSEADARAWLDRERANVVAIVVHCAGHGWPEHAADLARTLFRYFLNGSHLHEAQSVYSHVLQASRQSGNPAAEAVALGGLGGIAMMSGRFHDAAGYYREVLELNRQRGDRAGQARALQNLGNTEAQLHNPRSAADYFRQAIATFEDAKEGLSAARARTDLAAAETELGWYDQAAEHLQSALPVLRDAKHHVGEADALSWMGDLCLRRGELTQAADFYGQALAICRRIEYPTGVAAGLVSLGVVSLRQGEHPQAISCLRQALALYREAGHQYGEIMALRNLAEALHGAGEPTAARAELTVALRLAAETGNSYQQASTHRDLAEGHYSAGDTDLARDHWEQALALFTELGAAEAGQVRARLAALDSSECPSP